VPIITFVPLDGIPSPRMDLNHDAGIICGGTGKKESEGSTNNHAGPGGYIYMFGAG
jgi:hypothetical protein